MQQLLFCQHQRPFIKFANVKLSFEGRRPQQTLEGSIHKTGVAIILESTTSLYAKLGDQKLGGSASSCGCLLGKQF